MLKDRERALSNRSAKGRLRRGRPRRWIADCLDNLLDCVNHQLRFLDLNIVRAFYGDCVFGIWRKRRQRILSRVPCLVQRRRKISGQRLPWTQVEGLTLRQNKKWNRAERLCCSSFLHLIQAGIYVERLDVVIFFVARRW